MGSARIFRALLLAAAALATAPAAHADSNALWHIVHDECVANFTATGNPAPCRSLHFEGASQRGDAILKDLIGATQFLLIPITPASGIEDPAILAPDAPNYFADAWDARDLVRQNAHADLPRDALSLAVNASAARSQRQLHIHIDCVRADVRDALHRLAGSIGTTWTALPEPLAGHRLRAMRIDGEALAANPFRLLAATIPAAEMGSHTLVLVGITFADGSPGFILLDGQTDLLHGDLGGGEDLQDHACALAGR
jgi:CDP-diacylglycerol pyrophosphatase